MGARRTASNLSRPLRQGAYSDDFTVEGTQSPSQLWVLGNYSLFVRPGSVVDLPLDESKDFFGTAYIAPDNTRLVLVITNYDV